MAEAHEAPQVFYEEGPRAGQVADGSHKVGWTLRRKRDGAIVEAFAFLINPQGLTRTDGSRATLQATQGGFYVNDFGPAATAIQLRQFVGSGKVAPNGDFYTAREDVQRFLKTIFLRATAAGDQYDVYFHDHHFERGFEQRIFFPPNALTVQRSAEQPYVWTIDLQMIGLELYPYGEVQATKTTPSPKAATVYVVRSGDTLEKIVRRLAGAHANAQRRKVARDRLLTLNPELRKSRRRPDGTIAKPLRVYVGEHLRLPA